MLTGLRPARFGAVWLRGCRSRTVLIETLNRFTFLAVHAISDVMRCKA